METLCYSKSKQAEIVILHGHQWYTCVWKIPGSASLLSATSPSRASSLTISAHRLHTNVVLTQAGASLLPLCPSFQMDMVQIHFFRKIYFIDLKDRVTEKARGRNFAFAHSLHKWVQQPWVGQANTRSLEIHPRYPHGWQELKFLGAESEVELGHPLHFNFACTVKMH